MITKQQYIESITKELEIIKHLGQKITPEQLSHKPTEKQRSVQELMHYLSYIFIAGVDTIVLGDKDAYTTHSTEPIPTIENFTQKIEREVARIVELVSPMSDETLAEDITMWGMTQSRALHLLSLLKIASAYKMQLFLYMKQSGSAQLNTMNLWAGMDTPPTV